MTDSNESLADGHGEVDSSAIQRVLAWSVHLFTASGVICCLLAIEATYAAQWQRALTWLLIAVVIDAVDGTFARILRVKAVLPEFDGTLLDNLIDYANYVIVPALIIHRAELLPSQWSMTFVALLCLASCYQFCQSDAKTPDHFFRGFPSYWNIVALYLLAMHLNQWANLAIVAVLVVMVFVPIKYVYVTRTRELRAITFPLTAIWSAMAIAILCYLPDPPTTIVLSSLAYVAYYVAISLYFTFASNRFPD